MLARDEGEIGMCWLGECMEELLLMLELGLIFMEVESEKDGWLRLPDVGCCEGRGFTIGT